MKRILVALALGAALSLTIAAKPADTARDKDCQPTTDLTISQMGTDLTDRLKATITNNSADMEYDDVEVRLNYFDTDNNAIGSETVVVRQDFEPGEMEDFSKSIDPPTAATRADLSIVCAEKVEDGRWKFWK